MISLTKEIEALLSAIGNQIAGSCVFLDTYTSTILQWTVGLEPLLLHQPAYLLALEDANTATDQLSPGIERAVIVVATLLTECEDHIANALSAHPFKECTIFCAFSEAAHASCHMEESDSVAFRSLASKYSQWMANRAGSARLLPCTIIHFPLLYSVFLPDVFLLPPCHDAFPALASNIKRDPIHRKENLSAIEAETTRIPLIKLAHSIAAILSLLHFKEETYVLGPTSYLLAQELGALPRDSLTFGHSRGPAAPLSVSLILIDRTLDLVGPLRHGDNLLERIFTVLPPVAPHVPDVAIDLEGIFTPSSTASSLPLPRGSLSAAHAPLDTIAVKKHKDALSGVCRYLVNALTNEQLLLPFDISKLAGNVGTAQLQALLEALARDKPAAWCRHLPAVQCAVATLQALHASKSALWDEIQGIEKILLLTAGLSAVGSAAAANSKSLLKHIEEVMSKPLPGATVDGPRWLPLRDVVILAALAYSLIGEAAFPREDEVSFRSQVIQRLLASVVAAHLHRPIGWLGEPLEQLVVAHAKSQSGETEGSESTISIKQLQLEIEDAVDEVLLPRLRELSTVRTQCSTFSKLLVRGSGPAAAVATYQPIVSQVMTHFQETAAAGGAALKDVERVSFSLGGLLKSGLGRLGLKKPHPYDNGTLVVFVVGGITCSEIKEIRDAAAKAGKTVLIGSTAIATADRVYNALFHRTPSAK